MYYKFIFILILHYSVESQLLVIGNMPSPTIVKSASNGTVAIVAANDGMVEQQPDKSDRGKALRQIIAAFIANIGTINTGLVFGFSAVAIPQLKLTDSTIQVDDSQISWIGKLYIVSKIDFIVIKSK